MATLEKVTFPKVNEGYCVQVFQAEKKQMQRPRGGRVSDMSEEQ
jgi:hypothetical protein